MVGRSWAVHRRRGSLLVHSNQPDAKIRPDEPRWARRRTAPSARTRSHWGGEHGLLLLQAQSLRRRRRLQRDVEHRVQVVSVEHGLGAPHGLQAAPLVDQRVEEGHRADHLRGRASVGRGAADAGVGRRRTELSS